MTVQYRDGERAEILRTLAERPHYYYAAYNSWSTRGDDAISRSHVADECLRDLVASGLVSYGQPGEPSLVVTDLGRLEILAQSEPSRTQTEATLHLLMLVRAVSLVRRSYLGVWVDSGSDKIFVRDREIQRLIDDGLVVVEAGTLRLTVEGGIALESYSPAKLWDPVTPDPDPQREALAEVVAQATEAAIPELTRGEGKFLTGVRLGQVTLVGGVTWSYRLDPLEEFQIDEADRESRFPGMIQAWMGLEPCLTLTARGHEVLAAWETAQKLEALPKSHDEKVQRRLAENHAALVDDAADTDEPDGGFPVTGFPDDREYAELAEAVARALWLSSVMPPDKKATFTHGQLVEGLSMLPTGVEWTKHHRVLKAEDSA